MLLLEISGPPKLLFEPMEQHFESRRFHSTEEVAVIVLDCKCKSLISTTME